MLPKSTSVVSNVLMGLAKKKTYHHGNLRAVLIQAGLELIAANGVRALTLREIGAHVGVSRTAAYRHFADKAKLLAAIREVGFEKFAASLEAGRSQGKADSASRLNGMGAAYVRFAREHPAHFEVMFSAPPAEDPAEASAAEQRAFQILEETIIEGQEKGELRAGDARLMACVTWSVVHGISTLKLDQMAFAQEMDSPRFVTACTTLMLGGLLAAKNETQ